MDKIFKQKKYTKIMLAVAGTVAMSLVASEVMAQTMDLGKMADSIISSFSSLTKLITAGSYLAGLGFSIGGILKFKQYKDNPTNITIGTPITFIVVAAALLFLPSMLSVTGATMFSGSGQVAGPTGTIFQ